MLGSLVHDVVDQVARQAVDTKAHCLGHLGKAFRFNLMLEHIRREISAFTMHNGLDERECRTLK